ncbi:deazapurine DNA modification protein DpdA family protein [Amycolatopsis thermoflava]|uniref:deazapurine DNA modification protein DpdA family protein n=1 Tax=Amycolatopsis thermoflava TaxID=84480 RepID=UPI003823ECB1
MAGTRPGDPAADLAPAAGPRRTLPRATGGWALDSGGFTELSLHGRWRTDARTYAAAVRRYAEEIGHLAWAAPRDWMVEAHVRTRTGANVATAILEWTECWYKPQLRQSILRILSPTEFEAHTPSDRNHNTIADTTPHVSGERRQAQCWRDVRLGARGALFLVLGR